jgi:hypothetical protein
MYEDLIESNALYAEREKQKSVPSMGEVFIPRQTTYLRPPFRGPPPTHSHKSLTTQPANFFSFFSVSCSKPIGGLHHSCLDTYPGLAHVWMGHCALDRKTDDSSTAWLCRCVWAPTGSQNDKRRK